MEKVEIIVREDTSSREQETVASPYDAFFALSGQDAVDPDAFKDLRAASKK